MSDLVERGAGPVSGSDSLADVDVVGLVGDIGGTHARFGLLDSAGAVYSVESLMTEKYPHLEAAARAYLELTGPASYPSMAALAVAGPIFDDTYELTNRGWRFSVSEMREALGLERLVMMNDFQALALALPSLGADDLEELIGGVAEPGRLMAVLGPGTGLGASGATLVGDRWVALRAEGGHRDLAAGNEREWQVIEQLRNRFGPHVSAERAVSGSGIVYVYEALGLIGGVATGDEDSLTTRQVVDMARTGDVRASEAVSLFSGWLGAIAGDLTLTLGARGGVFLGGGLLKKMGATFDRDLFTERFRAKGRFREYLETVPVWMIRKKAAALLGAAHVLRFPLDESR